MVRSARQRSVAPTPDARWSGVRASRLAMGRSPMTRGVASESRWCPDVLWPAFRDVFCRRWSTTRFRCPRAWTQGAAPALGRPVADAAGIDQRAAESNTETIEGIRWRARCLYDWCVGLGGRTRSGVIRQVLAALLRLLCESSGPSAETLWARVREARMSLRSRTRVDPPWRATSGPTVVHARQLASRGDGPLHRRRVVPQATRAWSPGLLGPDRKGCTVKRLCEWEPARC